MNISSLSYRRGYSLFATAIFCGGLLLLPHQAVAQANEPGQLFTVTAPRIVHRKIVGKTYTGIPIETVTLTREVSYAGLDLKSQTGKNELKKRIAYTAKEACNQLNKLYPASLYPPVPSDQDCYKAALKSGMDQVDKVIASASEKP